MSTVGRYDPLSPPAALPDEEPLAGATVDAPADVPTDGVEAPPDDVHMDLFGSPAPAGGPATTGAALAVGGAGGSGAVPRPHSYPLAGDAKLDMVADGLAEIGKGEKGASVEKLQTALEMAGYPLRRYGADGDFGKETAAAVTKLQHDAGLPETGKLDAATLAALETKSAAKLNFPEYDKLFADGVLNTTVAVGFDEHRAHTRQLPKLIDGLTAQGFTEVDVDALTPDELHQLGIDPATVDPDVTYYHKRFQHEGKDVDAVTKVIDPSTPHARDKFAKAMAEDEVVVYTGHGRVGSGPDFDHRNNAAGNFVIGKPYESGYVKLGANDLDRTAMTDDYQLMFFDGCNTNLYLDDLRSRPANKDTSNLDIVGASTTLPWSTSAADVLAFVDGLTSAKSVNEITHDLDAINRTGRRDRKHRFLSNGFGDNPPD